MKAHIVLKVEHVSPRSGVKTEMEMFVRGGEIETFYSRLTEHHRVIGDRVVLRKPRKVEHFSAYI